MNEWAVQPASRALRSFNESIGFLWYVLRTNFIQRKNKVLSLFEFTCLHNVKQLIDIIQT